MLELTAAMIATLTIDGAKMLESARRSFAGAAELANTLTRECGLPFRHSHRVVGTLVRQAVDRGFSPADVGSNLVAESAEQTLGYTVTCSSEQVRSSLSPEAVVHGIRTAGGANPEETSKVLVAVATRLEADRATLDTLVATAAHADRELDQRTREILAEPG
jgi:argininosuccinate lyase